MLLRVKNITDSIKLDKKKKNNSVPIEEMDEELIVDLLSEDGDGDTERGDEEVNDTEQVCEDGGGDLMPVPLEADDIVIQNDAEIMDLPPSSPMDLPVGVEMSPALDDVVVSPRAVVAPSPAASTRIDDDALSLPSDDGFNESFRLLAEMQVETYVQELEQYVLKTDLSERVYQWQKTIHPFLEGLKKREAFDINNYGSRILNGFGDNNRRQTMTFRNFCKGKEKWEIHRYFMALLPLVNVGNVTIDTETGEDGIEDINITILSRKMHHTEIEQFGHNDGEHE